MTRIGRCRFFSWYWIPPSLAFILATQTYSVSLRDLYLNARRTRALEGHNAALPLYQKLLNLNPRDVSAASHIAAHPATVKRHHRLGYLSSQNVIQESQHLTKKFLEWNFTPQGIADHIFSDETQRTKAKTSSAPLYLQPIRAGNPSPPLPTSVLGTCIQLFLLAVCLPISICHQYLGTSTVDLLQRMGIAFVCQDRDLLVPYCHVTPVQYHARVLYFATDLHPNVLSSINIDESFGTVMYIGPDSLALVDHWNSFVWISENQKEPKVADLGTGSGIQALTMALEAPRNCSVVCVDVNPRALALARLNFVWNGMPEPLLILGDLRDPSGGTEWDRKAAVKPWKQWLEKSTMILANPPFLPVPTDEEAINRRHGLFSSGGGSGEEILARVVELASECLELEGTLAIVSEFMNPQTTLPSRLRRWWGENSAGRAVLFSNEQQMDAATYAKRRADSVEEEEDWKRHLEREGISYVSPGLVFIQKTDGDSLQMESYLVPKTSQGSIWTPTNLNSREFTHKQLRLLDFI